MARFPLLMSRVARPRSFSPLAWRADAGIPRVSRVDATPPEVKRGRKSGVESPERNTSHRRQIRLSPAGIVGPALLAVLIGCGGTEAPSVTGMPVVLISIDTLRSDRLPAYGYRGVETPAIDRLRRDAILFERAYSPMPLTLPAHTSILTGLLPPEHGVRDNIGYRLDSDRVAYLPKLLQEAGYATGAAVSAFVLRGRTGLDAGFDLYEDAIEFRTGGGMGAVQRGGDGTVEAAGDWLRGVADRPFFLFLHLYEPHTPYSPPEPFASRYASAYDGEIAAADEVVGTLLDELRRLGVYDRALVILLSDHGEGLDDHGEREHGVLLYREALQVPLLLKLPGARRAGDTVAAPAQLTDVMPTVLELLEMEVPEAIRGKSLLDLADDETSDRTLFAETVYPRLHFGWSDLASAISDRYHFIEGPDPELYDLVADPAESTNLLADADALGPDAKRAARRLREAVADVDRTLTAPAMENEETRAALTALGYLGGAAEAGDGPLADPKSQIHTLAVLGDAFRAFSQKDWEEAIPRFRKALEIHPRMLDAWEHLALSLHRSGRLEEAVGAYREALELSLATPHLALSAAALYLELGRLDETVDHARLGMEANEAAAYGLLARVAVRRGRLDEAERLAREALDRRESRLGPLLTLAEVLQAAGRPAEALEVIDRAGEEFERRRHHDTELIRGLYFLRGKALADLGRPTEAAAAFEREIELFPTATSSYTHLALLHALGGRPEAVGESLRRMVEANPTAAAYGEAVETLQVLGDDRSAAALLRRARRLFPEDPGLRELGT